MSFVTKLCLLFLCALLAPRSSRAFQTNHGVGMISRKTALGVAMPFEDDWDPIPSSIKRPKIHQQRSSEQLDPEDAWISNLDYEAFGKDVSALGKELRSNTGDADADHLFKLIRWRDWFALAGLSTVWMAPNPLTIVALSTWTYASWTMIAHHTCHGGYNKVEATGKRFKSRRFALGPFNRMIDWMDWMQPEAWNLEHNRLHHYNLNEENDPDLMERNFGSIRNNETMPMAAKYAIGVFMMFVWKWFYYAPNTYKQLMVNELVKSTGGTEEGVIPKDLPRDTPATVTMLLNPFSVEGKALRTIVPWPKFMMEVMGPMLVGRFLMIPILLWMFVPGTTGAVLAGHAFWNLVAAELLTNAHAFITITTNHAGEDLYYFEDAVKPNTGSFYVHQIVGSTNFATGTDPIDFSHGFLNYQIEHHVWPDLSMLQYQKGAPKLKAICEKHGVPYTQENVFKRLRKTFDIIVGKTSMRKFPTGRYEPLSDKVDPKTYWESTEGALEE